MRCAFTAPRAPAAGRDARLRVAAVVRGERRGDRVRLLRPGVRECPRQLRLHRLPLRGVRAAAGERGRDRGEDGGSSHSPTSSRAASASGSPRRASRPASARRRTARAGTSPCARRGRARDRRRAGRRRAAGRPSRDSAPTAPRRGRAPCRRARRAFELRPAQRNVQRGVAVADEHDLLLGQEQRRERGLARRARTPTPGRVRCRGRARRSCAEPGGSSPLQPLERPLAQHAARPRGGDAGVAAELDEVERASHREVVVPAEADVVARARTSSQHSSGRGP